MDQVAVDMDGKKKKPKLRIDLEELRMSMRHRQNNQRDSDPYSNYRDSAPHNNYRDSAPQNNYRDSAPYNNYRDSSPHNNYRDSAPYNNHREASNQYPRASSASGGPGDSPTHFRQPSTFSDSRASDVHKEALKKLQQVADDNHESLDDVLRTLTRGLGDVRADVRSEFSDMKNAMQDSLNNLRDDLLKAVVPPKPAAGTPGRKRKASDIGGNSDGELEFWGERSQYTSAYDRTTDPIHPELAKLVSSCFLVDYSDQEVRKISDNYSRPSNLFVLKPPKINVPVQQAIPSQAIKTDNRLKKVQELFGLALQPMFKVYETVLEAEIAADDKEDFRDSKNLNLSQVVKDMHNVWKLMGFANFELAALRRQNLARFMPNKLQHLNRRTVPVTEWLFGDDSQDEAEEEKKPRERVSPRVSPRISPAKDPWAAKPPSTRFHSTRGFRGGRGMRGRGFSFYRGRRTYNKFNHF